MLPTLARTVFLVFLGLGLAALPCPQASSPRAEAAPDSRPADRTVFLAGEMSDVNLVAFTANLAASGHPGVLLLDSPRCAAACRDFLTAFQPEGVIPVGSFADRPADQERYQGLKLTEPWTWKRSQCPDLWQALFPRPQRAVVCPAKPAGRLLQAACLAGAMRAPLFVLQGDDDNLGPLVDGGCREVWAVGAAAAICGHVPGLKVHALAGADAVARRYREVLLRTGPIENLVLANPADARRGLGRMSLLAPWLAVQKRAALLLTNDDGDNATEVLRRALQHPDLRRAESLIIAADQDAIPPDRRPNPAPGKDAAIEMEPLTPTGHDPFTLATGRLFHQDLGVVTLMLARQRQLAESDKPRRALVASNPSGGLPFLEVFSRHTANELHNRGYRMCRLFGDDLTAETLRRRLPECDVFLWEGHHNTLIKDWGFAEWTEPLPPAFVFLQSCLALTEEKAQPLLQRGAVAVVGSSTRIYSATGGAFSLAYFDALLYEGQSLGGALRQAKNFLLAYAMLKDKRLGKDAALTGANMRSAWAFTLWGDPTLHLPSPRPADDSLSSVKHRLDGQELIVSLPDDKFDEVRNRSYEAQMSPNQRLAGLITRDPDTQRKHVVPFVFVEVPLPHVPHGQTPRLKSLLPSSRWVFCWDTRRKTGYLLAEPRPGDCGELSFTITMRPAYQVSLGIEEPAD